MSGPVAEYGHAVDVADAVLYEGYLLYPYRKSSGKNRVRWQFGVLAPRTWVPEELATDTGISGSADAWRQRTECLLEAPASATVHMRLRFLRTRHRSVQAACPDRGFRPVGELTVDGEQYLTFDEAIPREYDIEATVGELCEAPRVTEIFAPPGEEIERLGDVGRVVWTTWPVRAVVRLSAERADAPFPLVRLRAEIENTGDAPTAEAPRTEALRVSLVATHSLLSVRGGSFLSLLDPPVWAEAAAKECRNVHTFPVLAGDAGRRDVMLSAPILMYDHPEVSPESPGAMFDATEIDEILSLRTLTLTDEEKREARATDPRAAEIIDRVDGIPREVLDRLHGAVRSLRPLGAGQDESPSSPPRWWEPGADSALRPDSDAVLVDGVRVAKGSQVRLRPRRHGADAHDMFLDGRTGLVEAVFLDVDDSRHVAVTIVDDPGADLHRWYGRYYYFAPDELEPIGTTP
ncbi:hypothetical protein [Amycolatopsis pigmentata]|uniref:Uncharacterized protein n=1 Tax=Amycolatopsis pigmentata TaxID=450801 RepID=A0ABW5FPB2_9PSEU